MANRDYNGDGCQPGYMQWKEAGGVPDAYVEPEVAPPAADARSSRCSTTTRTGSARIEGQPPLSLADFIAKASERDDDAHRNDGGGAVR